MNGGDSGGELHVVHVRLPATGEAGEPVALSLPCARRESTREFKERLVEALRKRRILPHLQGGATFNLAAAGTKRVLLDEKVLLEGFYLFEDVPAAGDPSAAPVDLVLLEKGGHMRAESAPEARGEQRPVRAPRERASMTSLPPRASPVVPAPTVVEEVEDESNLDGLAELPSRDVRARATSALPVQRTAVALGATPLDRAHSTPSSNVDFEEAGDRRAPQPQQQAQQQQAQQLTEQRQHRTSSATRREDGDGSVWLTVEGTPIEYEPGLQLHDEEYRVIKINHRGRRQERVLRLTNAGMENVRGSKVTFSHTYASMMCVTLADADKLAVTLLDGGEVVYESAVAMQIVQQMNRRLALWRLHEKRQFTENLARLALKVQQRLDSQMSFDAAMHERQRLRDGVLLSVLREGTRPTAHAEAMMLGGGAASGYAGRASVVGAGAHGDASENGGRMRGLSRQASKLQMLTGMTEDERLQQEIDRILLSEETDEGRARHRFIQNFGVLEKKPEQLLETLRQFVDSLRQHMEVRRLAEVVRTAALPGLSGSRGPHPEAKAEPVPPRIALSSDGASTPDTSPRTSPSARDAAAAASSSSSTSTSTSASASATSSSSPADPAPSAPSPPPAESAPRAPELQPEVLQLLELRLESAVVAPVYQRIVRMLRKTTQDRDLALQAKIAPLRAKDQRWFGIQERELSSNMWRTACFELSFLEKKALPAEKLEVLLNTARAIYNSYNFERNKAADLERALSQRGLEEEKINKVRHYFLAADEFFPIFVYVVVNAQVQSHELNRQFMLGLCDRGALNGEAGYYLTVYEAALEYIAHLDPTTPPAQADAAKGSGGGGGGN